MKKYIAIALTLVLTAALFAGCRSRNDTGSTSAPTVMPTVELPTRESTETPTAGPTEASSMPTVSTTPMDTESTGGSDATMTPDGTDMGTNPAGRRIPGGR